MTVWRRLGGGLHRARSYRRRWLHIEYSRAPLYYLSRDEPRISCESAAIFLKPFLRITLFCLPLVISPSLFPETLHVSTLRLPSLAGQLRTRHGARCINPRPRDVHRCRASGRRACHDQQERAPCQRVQSRAQQGCRPLQALPCQRRAPGRCALRDARCAEGARQAPALRLPAQVSAPADGRGQREPVQAAVQSLAGRFPSVYSPAGLPCLSANMNSLCSPCAGGGATSMRRGRSSSTSPTSGRGPRRSPRYTR